MQGARGRYASGIRATNRCGAAELLVSAVCGRWMRAPSDIHLRVLAISIIFGANLRCVYILLVIYAILHRKNEYLFDRGQFG